jgi:hypothetical protein
VIQFSAAHKKISNKVVSVSLRVPKCSRCTTRKKKQADILTEAIVRIFAVRIFIYQEFLELVYFTKTLSLELGSIMVDGQVGNRLDY